MMKMVNVQTGEITEVEDEVFAAPPAEDRRRVATLTKRGLLLRLVTMNILSVDEAVSALRGVFPATFATALTGLSPTAKAAMQMDWIEAQNLRPGSPLLRDILLDRVKRASPAKAPAEQAAERAALIDTIFNI